MSRQAIDANIVVYAFADLHEPEKTRIATALIARLADAGECVVSTQVLKEFANVATKKAQAKLSQPALEFYLEALAGMYIVTVDTALVLKAVKRHFTSKISYYDALIVEAAIAGGASVLYSQDMNHGQWMGTLQVINPFL